MRIFFAWAVHGFTALGLIAAAAIAVFVVEAESWWLLVPLVASAYGFSQVDAKTGDGYFLGFPSYWNVVAFYLYFLKLEPWMNLGILLALAILTFVPLKYFYPTQPGFWNRLTCVLAAVWGVLLVAILMLPPEARRPWLLASMVMPLG